MWHPDEDGQLGADALVSDMMTKVVIAVRRGDTVRLATKRVIEERIGAVPVLDPDGQPLGILSQLDLLRAARLGEQMTAAELMTSPVRWIKRGSPLAQAAALMAERRIHHLVVVDDDGIAVGMLSSLDLMTWMAQQAGYVLDDSGA